MKIFLTVVNCGDGSSSIEAYDNREAIERLQKEDPEGYSDGDGGCIYEIEATDFKGLIIYKG